MWKRLAVVGVVAFLATAAPAAAQDIQPPPDEMDPSGCNEYHRMRETLSSLAGVVPEEFQTGEVASTEPVMVDPLYEMLSSQILWQTGVFPCN